MGTTYYSVDRPRFFALAISSVTGQPYQINDIEQFSTSKRDDGSAGSWNFTVPLVEEYEIASQTLEVANPYVGVVAPMDLVALYAWRNTAPNEVGAGQMQRDPVVATRRERCERPVAHVSAGRRRRGQSRIARARLVRDDWHGRIRAHEQRLYGLAGEL